MKGKYIVGKVCLIGRFCFQPASDLCSKRRCKKKNLFDARGYKGERELSPVLGTAY